MSSELTMSQYSENHYFMSMYADVCLDFLTSVSAYACTLFTTDILINQLTRRNKNYWFYTETELHQNSLKHILRNPYLPCSSKCICNVERLHSVYSEHGTSNSVFVIDLQLHHCATCSHLVRKAVGFSLVLSKPHLTTVLCSHVIVYP